MLRQRFVRFCATNDQPAGVENSTEASLVKPNVSIRPGGLSGLENLHKSSQCTQKVLLSVSLFSLSIYSASTFSACLIQGVVYIHHRPALVKTEKGVLLSQRCRFTCLLFAFIRSRPSCKNHDAVDEVSITSFFVRFHLFLKPPISNTFQTSFLLAEIRCPSELLQFQRTVDVTSNPELPDLASKAAHLQLTRATSSALLANLGALYCLFLSIKT